MRRYVLIEWVVPIILTSLAYLLAFAVTFQIVMPIQDVFLPSYASFASLLFLPHGVRVITGWLYGWRSLLLLSPAAISTHIYLFGLSGYVPTSAMAALSGVFCAALSFWFFAMLGVELRHHKALTVNWREVILVGVFASIMNSVWTTIFFRNDIDTAVARFVGDVTGMFVSFLILMMVFRTVRLHGAKLKRS